jgi:hypothetical protein
MKAVGMDVGSTTVKAVVLEEGRGFWQDYRRHGTRQAETALAFLARMEAEAGLVPERVDDEVHRARSAILGRGAHEARSGQPRGAVARGRPLGGSPGDAAASASHAIAQVVAIAKQSERWLTRTATRRACTSTADGRSCSSGSHAATQAPSSRG